ncbi:MAG: CPBP family intramembrane metalloprotease [Desulfobulbus sp.]|nr:CPBP family intramembrane metalloprotease [Desulfobulbus sp.]
MLTSDQTALGIPRRTILLWAEFFTLYFFIPLFYAFHRQSSPLMFLVLLGVAGVIFLYKNESFRNDFLLNKKGWVRDLPRILRLFLVIALGLLLFTALVYPQFLFSCPRNHFSLWLSLMVVYPLLAVYPQELIYRAFLFHRYGEVVRRKRQLMHLSAIAFAFGHIIYFHPLSIILTFFGGYLFSWTYFKTRSLLAVSFEHALYGCLLYTIGLGQFFYTGFDMLVS